MTAQMFDGFDAAKYEDEARQRWGKSPEFEESVRRAKAFTKQDWDEIKREGGEIMERLAVLMDRDPADPEVQRWVGRHHRQINDRFYACGPEVYRGLGDLYADDPRFTAVYDNVKPGLARFLRDAMHVYSRTLEKA